MISLKTDAPVGRRTESTWFSFQTDPENMKFGKSISTEATLNN